MEKFFDKAGKFIIKYKFFILAVFVVLMGVSGVLANQVKINEDMTKYMPSDSAITKAIEINTAEFGNNETLTVMISEVANQSEANSFKGEIQKLNKVEKVSQIGLESDKVLFHVTLKGDLTIAQSKEAVDDIRSVINKKIAMAGHVVTENYVDSISAGEAQKLLMVLIPVLLLILLLSSKSFIDPVICLIVLAVSTVIGMGTNVIFSDISSITNNMFSVLMIAISMDYSIFMLHTFKEEKEKGKKSKEAVLSALKKSFTTITSASMTTIAGFIAMVFMRFSFGADIGWVFAKGILISLITALLLMPCLLLLFDKVINKTSHREFLPSFKPIGKGIVKAKWFIMPVVLVLIIGGFFLTQNNNFIYGNSTLIETKGTSLYEDNQAIVEAFGRKNPIAVLVPKHLDAEKLATDLATLDERIVVEKIAVEVTEEMKLQNPELAPIPVGMEIEFTVVPGKVGNYNLIKLNLDMPEESDETFALVKNIQDFCGNEVYLLGASSVSLDMKEIVEADYLLVTFLTMAAILLILGIVFKSWSMPLIVLLCVQGGVFINMAIPALTGQAIPYVAYLLISTIQLGVTIDYAILISTKYMANRKIMGKRESAIMAIHQASGALITGGGILMGAGFAMFATSSDPVVSQMGMLLGRGAFISLMLAFAFLPAMLIVLDKIIKKTTYKTDFTDEPKLIETKNGK